MSPYYRRFYNTLIALGWRKADALRLCQSNYPANCCSQRISAENAAADTNTRHPRGKGFY